MFTDHITNQEKSKRFNYFHKFHMCVYQFSLLWHDFSVLSLLVLCDLFTFFTIYSFALLDFFPSLIFFFIFLIFNNIKMIIFLFDPSSKKKGIKKCSWTFSKLWQIETKDKMVLELNLEQSSGISGNIQDRRDNVDMTLKMSSSSSV